MAALPEDDGPTMTGAPGQPRVDHALPPVDAGDGDDTTTAEAGPPAARRDDPRDATHPSKSDDAGAHDPHAGEDRTVQQSVGPPSRPPAPVPAAGAPPASAIPSTEPDAVVATAPAVAPITQTSEIEPTDITADLADEDDALEDSITATAPRLDHANLMDAARSGVPLVIPGSVEIRSVDPDDNLDETEIRTLPGNSALHAAASLRSVPSPRPAAGMPPSTPPDTENDDDDGITTRSLSPAMSSKAAVTQRAASPRPAAGVPFHANAAAEASARPASASATAAAAAAAGRATAVDGAEEPATSPGLDGVEEPATRPGVEGIDEPATRPGVIEPPTRPGTPDPETAERLQRADVVKAYESDDDESVTARSHPNEPYDEEESVTTQAPAVPPSIIEAAIKNPPHGIADATLDDGTDGTTQRVKKTREAASSASPADGEAESITTQAPGPLTNILRVIASGSSPGMDDDELPALDDDEPPENRTAVMANAPLKRVIAELASASPLPAIRPTGGPLVHGVQGSAAPRLEPSSESGLRVTRTAADVERASLGALGIPGDANARVSGVGPRALASDGSISANVDRAQMNGDGVFPAHGQPPVHEVDLGKGPRYGLLVAVVAAISIAVPLTLFFVLHHASDGAAVPGVPSEPASEIEKHDGARVKAVRGKNGQMVAPSASIATSASPPAVPSGSASAAPSSSSSSKPGGRGFPLRR